MNARKDVRSGCKALPAGSITIDLDRAWPRKKRWRDAKTGAERYVTATSAATRRWRRYLLARLGDIVPALRCAEGGSSHEPNEALCPSIFEQLDAPATQPRGEAPRLRLYEGRSVQG